MAVSKKLRFEVFRRDDFRCRYCGSAAKDGAVLEPDHVVPRARGGLDIATNLLTACEPCNSGKRDTPMSHPLIEDVPEELFRRSCDDRGVKPPQARENSAPPAGDLAFQAGRLSMARQVLDMANDWDKRHAVQKTLQVTAPHSASDEELDIRAGTIAAESAFEDLERLCEILMGFLHSMPGGREHWKAAVAHLKATQETPLRPVDVIEEAVHRVLTSIEDLV